jgi:DegV family protein with EDD domain
MTIKVLADSSCEMPEALRQINPVISVPFKLYIDNEELIDNNQLNVIDFIDRMVKSTTLPRSACPAPNDFQDHFGGEDDCYIVTISSRLSGTYNSAMLAKSMLQEENPNKFVHVFDSKSASIGETLIALKIHELDKKNCSRVELIDQVNAYINEMRTFFVSESLDNLMKNGRISKLKGTLATVLKIKPIMGSDSNGEIELIDKARGSAKALQRMVELIVDNAKCSENKVLAISHVNNLEKANWIKEEVMKRCNFKDIIVVQTGGLSSLYCDNQGIIVAF